MFRKLLKQIGLENLVKQDKDQRESNIKKWKEENEPSFRPKRRDHLHNHVEPHKPKHPHLDNDHCHDDWTY